MKDFKGLGDGLGARLQRQSGRWVQLLHAGRMGSNARTGTGAECGAGDSESRG